MITERRQIDDSLDILLTELMADEELLDAFLRDPARTLNLASDWALPLTESELQSIRTVADRLWERLAHQLEMRCRAN
jgi:hypothetical protein